MKHLRNGPMHQERFAPEQSQLQGARRVSLFSDLLVASPRALLPAVPFCPLSSTNPKGKSPPFDTQERRSLKSQGKE